MNRLLVLLCSLVFASQLSCQKRHASNAPPVDKSSSPTYPLSLVPVQDAAGIDFTLGHNGKTPLSILETAGGGCAFLDFDSDSWPDILLVGPHNAALYRNLGHGKFRDVTGQSGINRRQYWMGCTTGDYDGDGRPDIFLTGFRCQALLHNEGGGRFRDVTEGSGIEGLQWSLSAAFADYDGDGKLDLFVSQYVVFDNSTPTLCTVGNTRSACGPEVYKPLSGKLFKNLDGRGFRGVSWRDSGKTWGALASDLLNVGRPSLYLANDMVPCDLWTARPEGWVNIGPVSGTAYDGQGNVQGGMGADSGDYDNDGRLDLIVTTYFGQQVSLYHNDGKGIFSVASGTSGIGPPTMPYVKFGVALVDLDNDGWLDIAMANGHVRDNVKQFDAAQSYPQPLQTFYNQRGKFVEVSQPIGSPREFIVGRGMAVGDINRDGRQDILACNLEGKAVLLENRSPARQWLDVRLRQPGSNRFAVGAMIRLTRANLRQTQEIRTCMGLMSSREPIAHFGLGDTSGPVDLSISWPDGKIQAVHVNNVNRMVSVDRQ